MALPRSCGNLGLPQTDGALTLNISSTLSSYVATNASQDEHSGFLDVALASGKDQVFERMARIEERLDDGDRLRCDVELLVRQCISDLNATTHTAQQVEVLRHAVFVERIHREVANAALLAGLEATSSGLSEGGASIDATETAAHREAKRVAGEACKRIEAEWRKEMEAFGGGRDAHFEAPPLNDRGAAVAGQLSASLEHIKTWCVRHCESSAAAGAGAAAALEEKLERLRKQLEVFTDAVETLVGGHAESSSCVVGSPDCAALATTVKHLEARVNASQDRI